jgi:hypothetical protein
MYNRLLVPKDFAVPDGLDCGSYKLRMLSADDVDMDFEAVVASTARLRGLFGPDTTWPEGVTRRENLVDLGWHEREFTLRHSFAYTAVSKDGSRCVGCVYIFPSTKPGYDAVAFYWVRSGPDADARDQDLGARFRAWLQTSWPFQRIAFPGRDDAFV